MLTMFSQLNHVHIHLWAYLYRFLWSHKSPSGMGTFLAYQSSYRCPYIRPNKKKRGPTRKRKELTTLFSSAVAMHHLSTCVDLYVTTFHDLHTVISSSGFRLLCTPCQTPDNHDPPPKDGNLAYTNHQHQHWTFQQSPPLKTGRHLTIVWGYITQDE